MTTQGTTEQRNIKCRKDCHWANCRPELFTGSDLDTLETGFYKVEALSALGEQRGLVWVNTMVEAIWLAGQWGKVPSVRVVRVSEEEK